MRALGPRAALLLLLAARSAARRLDDEQCHDVFGNCAAYVAAGHTCEASFCEGCDWAGQCDAFCGVCGGECRDTYDHCQAFIGTSAESCSDLFCEDCSFSGYCDASCGLCYVPPSAAPTPWTSWRLCRGSSRRPR